jgi:mono/diheme cytochrome c family protein
MKGTRQFILAVGFIFSSLAFSQYMGIAEYAKGWTDISKHMKHGMETGFAPVAATKASIKKGLNLYKINCQPCHGPSARGDGPLSRSLKTKPADLTRLARRFPRHRFFMKISLGTGDMPAWKHHFTNEQLWHLTNFIKSLELEEEPQ